MKQFSDNLSYLSFYAKADKLKCRQYWEGMTEPSEMEIVF